MRFGPYDVLERREIEGGGLDLLARDRHGAQVRLWAGRPGSATEPGPAVLEELRRDLARLHHATLPRILGAESIEGHAVLLVAPYRGPRLADRLRDGGVPPLEALDVARSVGAGLAKAHARGLVHGAVGCAEIVCGEDGRTILPHLGFGPFLGQRGARGPGPPDEADVFGLARALFECLTGRDPFSAGLFRDPDRPDPEEMDPELPEGLRRLLARALLADAGRRLRRADELAGDLAVIRASWGGEGRPRPSRRWRGPGILVALGAALAASWAFRGCFEAILRGGR